MKLGFWEFIYDLAEWVRNWVYINRISPAAEKALDEADKAVLTYSFYNSQTGAVTDPSPYWHGGAPFVMFDPGKINWTDDPQEDRVDAFAWGEREVSDAAGALLRFGWDEFTSRDLRIVNIRRPDHIDVVQEETNCQIRSSSHEGKIVEMKERLSSKPHNCLLAKPPLWRSESSFELLRHYRAGKKPEFPNGLQPPTPLLPKTTTE